MDIFRDVNGSESVVSTEAVVAKCFVKNNILRNFAKFTGKRLCQSLFFNKVCSFVKKENQAQVFSCEFYEIFENTFSYRTPPVAAFFSKVNE